MLWSVHANTRMQSVSGIMMVKFATELCTVFISLSKDLMNSSTVWTEYYQHSLLQHSADYVQLRNAALSVWLCFQHSRPVTDNHTDPAARYRDTGNGRSARMACHLCYIIHHHTTHTATSHGLWATVLQQLWLTAQ